MDLRMETTDTTLRIGAGETLAVAQGSIKAPQGPLFPASRCVEAAVPPALYRRLSAGSGESPFFPGLWLATDRMPGIATGAGFPRSTGKRPRSREGRLTIRPSKGSILGTDPLRPRPLPKDQYSGPTPFDPKRRVRRTEGHLSPLQNEKPYGTCFSGAQRMARLQSRLKAGATSPVPPAFSRLSGALPGRQGAGSPGNKKSAGLSPGAS